jgi:rhodanese-related sulfurtransferase
VEIDSVIDAEQARELIASNRATAVDIRGDDAWRDKRVPGARHASEEDLETALEQVDEEQIVLVVCADGRRSAELAEKLRESGRQATCIDGGMDAWESAKFPLQPSDDPADDATV